MFRLNHILISAFCAVFMAACGAAGGGGTVDRTDPASVAKAFIAAWRDRDFAAMVDLIHPDDRSDMRALAESPTGEEDAKEWDMFNPKEDQIQVAEAWKGMLDGPKYEDGYALYAYTAPDEYNERMILVLEEIDGQWVVYENWYYEVDEFNALSDTPPAE